MMRFIEMMDLGFEFFNSAAVVSARQFKTARGRWRSAIHGEIIEHRGNAPAHKDEESPYPFAPAQRINEHPKLEQRDQRHPRIAEPIMEISKIGYERGQHQSEE